MRVGGAPAGGLAPPLYLHSSILEEAARDKWARQMQRVCVDTVGDSV